MKFETMEKCGPSWFSSLDRSAQAAAADVGYHVHCDLESLQIRLNTLAELVGQQGGEWPIENMDGLGLILGDYAQSLGELVEYCRDMRSGAGRQA